MERVTFILHVSLTLLVAAAGAIFALAEGRTGIPAITIPVAIVACFLVDHFRLWRLSTGIQNLLGLAAFAAAGIELYLSDIEAPLLAGGHLLSYLTCAFLLQPKGRRQFWWLTALSVLQVAVASVLTYDSWFGLVLPLFLLTLLWTMSVFQLQQAAETAQGTAPAKTPAVHANSAPQTQARSIASRTAQLDEQHRWITPRFILSMLTGTALSLVLAGIFFIFIPRVWTNLSPVFEDGGRPIGGAPAQTGYTNKVTLGQIGEIQESGRIALEATLQHREGGGPANWSEWLALVGDEPRFRGVTQEVYDEGSWSRWEGVERSVAPDLSDVPLSLSGGFRQQVRIYHQSRGREPDVVMTSGLPLSGRVQDPLRSLQLEPFSWSLASGHQRGAERTATYDLDVAPLEPWYPNMLGQFGPSQVWRRRGSNVYLSSTMQLPGELRDQLERWIAEHPALHPQSMSPYALARQYERWFQQDEEFSYSLNLSLTDPSLDPVMDFLRNTRRGHCEYFATALALLLRTHMIPTRVVTGYKGGQVTEDGKLVVRDLHAHLWVEAFVADAPNNPRTGQTGPRWMMLDPTPAARNSVVATQELSADSAWGRLSSGWRSAWTQGIRMSEYDQRALIYDPVADIVQGLWDDVSGTVKGGRGGLRRFLTSPREWFSWQGGLVAFLLMMIGTGGYRGLAALRRGRLRLSTSEVEVGSRSVEVPFYQRLEALLGEQGMQRRASETPREFVTAPSADWNRRVSPQVRPFPEQLAERFYAVRFGHQALTAEEATRLDQQLDELERDLNADALRRTQAAQPHRKG